ncbi:MAG TPA: chloride channel protein, partial [Balneolaceae bacterium]|nr:chloride channel protein [Balneolaceae bacterium]
NPYYFIFPIIGILITLLIKRFLKEKVGEGVPFALFAISRKNGILSPQKMYDSVITAIFTVGFGGSVGLEGPAVGTGAAIGSNLGRAMHINYRNRILLMSCASAGAIASIFNAPIAAIIFTIEIFSLDLTFSSLIPLLLSSISGAVTSILLQGDDHLIYYQLLTGFRIQDLPYYMLLGIFTALASVYFTRTYMFVDQQFNKIKNPRSRVLIGAGILGVLIFLVPPLYGEGYETTNSLLNGNLIEVVDQSLLNEFTDFEYFSLLLILGLIFTKAIATSVTMSAGGVGGVFAPSLFTGASLGFLFSRTINDLNLGQIPESTFALVGMAGLMAGVLHAPLTAVFMIAEITGGYELFLPLMIVSAVSFLISRHFLPYSFYTHELAKKGDLLTHNKDQVVLRLLNLKKIVEKNFSVVKPGMSLRKLIDVVSRSPRNIFPVVNDDGKLVGILTLDDIRSFMFDKALYDALVVAELMSSPPEVVNIEEEMDEVMKKFQDTGAWNLPVVDYNRRYIGFISKSKMFSVYRRKLIEFTA